MRGLWFWGCGRGRGKVRVEEWGGDMSLWVSNFGGVSDEERDGKVEAAATSEALHHDTVR